MGTCLFFILTQLVYYADWAGDPIHSAWTGRRAARTMDCERLSQADAHAKYPSEVPAPDARSTALIQIDALACRHHVVADGAREPRDELILQGLLKEVGDLSALAAQNGDDETRWVVDAYYPNASMVRKIASASRVALAERGLKVSDQPPLLSAGDVEVLRSLPMRTAIPLTCRRLHETRALEGGPLGDKVAFLAIALLHPKESQLHAGLCRDGKFRWLR